MTDQTMPFYQQLAADYHLIYVDWSRAIERQGTALDRLIRAHLGERAPLDLLDCSCGIGTQAIGLAARGYHVHATDLSPAAVERAGEEAVRHGVTLTTGVADMRHLDTQVSETFDIVLSCDNSLPHLLTDDDLHLAARAMRSRLRPDGLLLISTRDYDQLTLERPHATSPNVIDDADGRRIVFQVWDWAEDGSGYTFNLFILRERAGEWHTACYTSTYRALLRADLSAILAAEGFADVRWHMPQDTGYMQPVVTARRG